jgi:hypothetical protein
VSTTDTDPMARYRDFHKMYDLDDMRSTLAKLADLPDDTSIHLFLNDGNEEDSYTSATELQVTYWDGYERCAKHDEGAKLALFFTYPGENRDGVAGEGSVRPISRLTDLREAIASLDGLPGDTSVSTFEDGDEEDPFVFAELQVACWNGEIQCEEGDEGASTALFVIPC